MDLRDYVRLLRRNWFLLVVAALVGLLAGLLYAGHQTPRFQATSAVVVSTGQSSDVTDLNAAASFAQVAVKTYATVATSPLVLQPVIDKLHLKVTPAQLSGDITTDIPLDTSALTITVEDTSAQRAAQVANQVASSLRSAVTGFTPSTTRTADVSITLITPATVPTVPVSPKVPVDAALGFIVGLLLGLGATALREALGVKVRDERDVESLTKRPVIGRILYDRTLKDEPILFRSEPDGPSAESFRSLRTALHFLDFEGEQQSFVITSAVEGEGKSIVAANLAVAVGGAGQRVVVIDADLRRPRIADYFGLEGTIGLSDVLVGDVELDAALQTLADGRTAVLPAGRIPPNPTELLQSKAMIRLLDELRGRFQVVLLDGPPLLAVSDGGILARRTDGALLVASAGRVTRPQLRGVLRDLDAIGANVLGVVVTMLAGSSAGVYGYTPQRRRRSRGFTRPGAV